MSKIVVEFGKKISSIKINNVEMNVDGVVDMAEYNINHETTYNIEITCKSATISNMPISWDYTGKTFGNDSLVQHGDV